MIFKALSLVGGFPVWILCLFAFIADISEPKERAFRMMMITLAGNWGSPAAPIVGAKIFNFGNSLYENGKAIVTDQGKLPLLRSLDHNRYESSR